MWLGFSAAFIGMFYALVKFLTVYQLRRLNNDFISAQHELQKTQLGNLREKTEHQQTQLKANSEEFDTIVLDIEILQQQKDSLEAQETCMDNLDQFNTAPTVKKEKK